MKKRLAEEAAHEEEKGEQESSDGETPGSEKRESFKKPSFPASKLQPASLQHDIKRTREGVIIPYRNAFEFTVKPKSDLVDVFKEKRGDKNQVNGMEQLKKNILKLKKQNSI
jgi:hypothetical protein